MGGGDSISQKTGDAKIDRQGQTASDSFGSDPTVTGKYRGTPRDLRP